MSSMRQRLLKEISQGDVEALRRWRQILRREGDGYLDILLEVFENDIPALWDTLVMRDIPRKTVKTVKEMLGLEGSKLGFQIRAEAGEGGNEIMALKCSASWRIPGTPTEDWGYYSVDILNFESKWPLEGSFEDSLRQHWLENPSRLFRFYLEIMCCREIKVWERLQHVRRSISSVILDQEEGLIMVNFRIYTINLEDRLSVYPLYTITTRIVDMFNASMMVERLTRQTPATLFRR